MQLPVNQVISGVFIERVIKMEGLILQVLGQIHFLLGLMQQQGSITRDCDHINLFLCQL